MTQYEKLLALAKACANPVQTEYSADGETVTIEHAKQALRDGISELMGSKKGSYKNYRANKNLIFALIEETVDLVIPRQVNKTFGAWAEISVYGQGDAPLFRIKQGRKRAKKFITKVGLSGNYETFRLDQSTFKLDTEAFGGAGVINLERMADGAEDLTEVAQIILEGIEDSVYAEITKALQNSLAGANSNNFASANGVDATLVKGLIDAMYAYGDSVTIYGTRQIVGKLAVSDAMRSDADKSDMRERGYVGRFHSADVVALPQGFVDETNTVYGLSNAYLYIIPGGNEKIVKVGFEGDTIVNELQNRDNTIEVSAYKKFGVAVLTNNQFAMYKDTSV